MPWSRPRRESGLAFGLPAPISCVLGGVVWLLPALLLWAGGPASAAVGSAETPGVQAHDVSPARLVALADRVLAEVVLVRDEMGRPKDDRDATVVSNARPGDVRALASTLLLRADRLTFERTRELTGTIDVRGGIGGARGAYLLLDAAAARLLLVRESLGIPESAAVPERQEAASWNRVAETVLAANRQLDLLLDERLASHDVFERVTEAIGYAAPILATVGLRGLPQPPPYERRRRPSDVCARLITCLELLGSIAERGVVRVRMSASAIEHAGSGVAYDLAALNVSAIASLHTRTPGVSPPLPTYYPGTRLPSDTHQRAGILQLQLSELLANRDAYVERLDSMSEADEG